MCNFPLGEMMKQLLVKELECGQRFDKFLGKYLKEAPKSFIYKMLRKKNITLNGKKATGNEKLQLNDEIKLFLSDDTIQKFCGEEKSSSEIDLDIVYEDSQILFVNKPAGMLSQKAEKQDTSLVEYITGYLLKNKFLTKEDLRTFRPGVCNRLDRNTSGLVAAGKTVQGLQEMSKWFKERNLHKYYLTLVRGKIEKPAHIKGYLWKDEKKNMVMICQKQREGSLPIETKYEPLGISKNGDTLLKVELLTGRSHQIRSHLAGIGHPVIGDWKYGEKEKNECFRKKYGVEYQLLHAWILSFPETEGILEELSLKTIIADIPEKFQRVLEGEGLAKYVVEKNKGDVKKHE